MMPSRKLETYRKMHLEDGLSTARIASILGEKKNTVIVTLRNNGYLRMALGRTEENEVGRYMQLAGAQVEHHRGDWPHDFTIDGKKVDVKSATLSDNRYYFSLTTTGKDIQKAIDYFILVFKSGERPIYKLDTSAITCKIGLSIPASLKTKYKLKLLGFLGSQNLQLKY